MGVVTSKDGTAIRFDREGHGPPVVFVVGAFNDRRSGGPLAAALATGFTVFRYDRRGRGDSGDTLPYAVEREVEDLAAVIAAAGGEAAVFGYSSGAVLALRAAQAGLPISRVALYDLPLRVDGPDGSAHAGRLAALVAAGRRGDAVEYFQADMVGIPVDQVIALRHAPFRPALEAMAHTLVYEATLLGDGRPSADHARGVRQPTLLAAGGAHPFMSRTADALARLLPDGRAVTLEGANHDLVAEVLAPVLRAFLAGAPLDRERVSG